MKKIALYLSMFFAMIAFIFSSADVQAQEVENVESVGTDAELVSDHFRDDTWRFTVGLEHMAVVGQKHYAPFLSFKLGFYGKVADFYRTGIEVNIGHDLMDKIGGAVPINIRWMHVLRFLQVDFFDLSQRLGMGYFGFCTYGTEDDNGWGHIMSWLVGYEFGFRLTDLISLSLNLDYELLTDYDGIRHSIHAGVQIGFHF